MISDTQHPIVFWYTVPDPYMVDRFTALAQRGNVRFQCWFTKDRSNFRSWNISPDQLMFPHQFVPTVSFRGYRIGTPAGEWMKTRPRVMVSFHGDPHVALSSFQHLRPAGQLLYYVEKTFDTWVQRSRFKEAAKHALLGAADGFLTPGSDADEYVRRYSKSPIYRLNHVVDYPRFQPVAKMRSSTLIARKRQELGLEGFVFLNVGRMWGQKGIGTLIESFAEIERSGGDASLLLVGDGDDRERYEILIKALGLHRVVLLPFVQPSELPTVYALGDAFVFPTRGDPYGLVVDEAMASGLPVIASNSAGEIGDRVLPDKTGFLVQRDNVTELSGAMKRILQNADAAMEMGKTSQQFMRVRNLDHWVQQMETALTQVQTSTVARQ